MAEENGIASGFVGMFNAFVDPAGLAKRVPAKLFWVGPLVTVTIIAAVCSYLMMPFMMQLADVRIAQQSLAPDQLERAKSMTHMITQVIVFVIPVVGLLITLLLALLVSVTGSMVGLRTKFRDVFSIMAACSLISSLQFVATYVVLRSKGDEITSQDQMTPPFGLDIFINAHGPLYAILNFFSIFEIWYLVVLALTLSYFAGASKGKAFAAITPAWLLPLLFKIIGSLFQPKA
jgi:hypothetical protein